MSETFSVPRPLGSGQRGPLPNGRGTDFVGLKKRLTDGRARDIHRAGSVAIARLLMSLLFAIIPTSDAFAQKVDGDVAGAALNSEWHFRHELFQMLLEERGLKVAESLDAALASPQDSVIVTIGKLGRVHSAYPENLSTFAERGGAVLLALDSTASIGGIASFTSTSITSEDSVTQYQGHSDCLRVASLERSHPLVKGRTSRCKPLKE